MSILIQPFIGKLFSVRQPKKTKILIYLEKRMAQNWNSITFVNQWLSHIKKHKEIAFSCGDVNWEKVPTKLQLKSNYKNIYNELAKIISKSEYLDLLPHTTVLENTCYLQTYVRSECSECEFLNLKLHSALIMENLDVGKNVFNKLEENLVTFLSEMINALRVQIDCDNHWIHRFFLRWYLRSVSF